MELLIFSYITADVLKLISLMKCSDNRGITTKEMFVNKISLIMVVAVKGTVQLLNALVLILDPD